MLKGEKKIMIHSLAGGELGTTRYADFAKVEILSKPFVGDIYWYIACGQECVGDIVIVPLGKNNTYVQGKVIRIDKNISSQVSPVPFSRAKKVLKVFKSGD